MKSHSTKNQDRLNLSDLDRQLIDCTTSPTVSYGQLYEIARSIVDISFDRSSKSSLANNNFKSQDEYEETLAKILQLCQTIIDFLLADVKRLETEKSELSNRNNLIRENQKLRKLLQLQQKAIVFRRQQRFFASPSFQSLGVESQQTCSKDVNCDDEDDSFSSVSVSDAKYSKTFSNNSFSTQTPSTQTIDAIKLQCIYCPKVFIDSHAFAKHLTLSHLSSSVLNEYSAYSSLTSSSLISSFTTSQDAVRKLESQQQQNENVKQAQIKIEFLETEIDELKLKLNETETMLQNEKTARQRLENNLTLAFQDKIDSIQKSLGDKIEEIKFLQCEISLAQQNSSNDHESQFKNSSKSAIVSSSTNSGDRRESIQNLDSDNLTMDKQQEKNQVISLETSSEKIPNDETKTKEHSFLNHSDVSKAEEKTILENDATLKENLRSQLISQLCLEREKKKSSLKKDENQNELLQVKKSENKSDHSSSLAEERIDWIRLPNVANNDVSFRKKLDNHSSKINSKTNNNLEKFSTKSEISKSVEDRLKSLLTKTKNIDTNLSKDESEPSIVVGENFDNSFSKPSFGVAEIEKSIRDQVDLKARSQLNNKDNSQNDHKDEMILNSKKQSVDQVSTVELNHQTAIENISLEKNNLKSILKKNNGQKTKRLTPTQRITFNKEVTEFEISPLVSEASDLDNDSELELIKTNKNDPTSMSNQNDMIDRFAGDEKVFFTELSSSPSTTSSSDDEEKDDHHNQTKNLGHTAEVLVDVHHDNTNERNLFSIPVPAKRKTLSQQMNSRTGSSTGNQPSTLNSLLNDEDSNKNDDQNNNDNSDDKWNRSKVQQLAELIEQKLESTNTKPGGGSINNNNANENQQQQRYYKKLPPLSFSSSKTSIGEKSLDHNSTIALSYDDF